LSTGLGEGGVLTVVGGFEFGRWNVAAGLEEPAVVEPVDVAEGGQLDLLSGAPGAAGLDQFGLVQADYRFGQGVVVGVADGADRGLDAGGGQPVGERDRRILLEPASV